jgi:ribosomal protein S12 methylthiotransferase accessory factor
MAFAQSSTANQHEEWWSCGRDRDPRLAQVKARAEAIEWHACGRPEGLINTSLEELGPEAIDPLTVARYLPFQFNRASGLKRFDAKLNYEWKRVKEIGTDKTIYMLADFIYFPFQPKSGRPYFFANSSGAAAHSSNHDAIENAVLELVERDAFMIDWINKISGRWIKQTSLPSEIVARIRELKKAGFETRIRDLTLDLAPVIGVVVRSRESGFFSVSAASEFSVLKALDRALMEIEAAVYCKMRDGPASHEILPTKVRFPEDHGVLYENRTHQKEAGFLWHNNANSVSLKEVAQRNGVVSIDELCSRLKKMGVTPLCVDLSSGHNDLERLPYKVVKAFAPGLIPITFGFGRETLGMPRLQTFQGIRGNVPARTFSGNIFPHPFT